MKTTVNETLVNMSYRIWQCLQAVTGIGVSNAFRMPLNIRLNLFLFFFTNSSVHEAKDDLSGCKGLNECQVAGARLYGHKGL